MTIELSADDSAGRDRVLAAMSAAWDASGYEEPLELCDRTWHESYYECGGRAELYVLANCEICGQRLLKVCRNCHDSVDQWSSHPVVVHHGDVAEARFAG